MSWKLNFREIGSLGSMGGIQINHYNYSVPTFPSGDQQIIFFLIISRP